MQKYSVNQYPVSTILSWVQAKEIAIPEIQRPFVWNTKKVGELLDSLYQGYPVGYIIAWKNPNVRLRDGKISEGKKVLIDGQQRITALRAAILGEPIIDSEYKERRIYIAFNPTTERFETQTPVIKRDSLWIPDIAQLMRREGGLFDAVRKYCDRNPQVDKGNVEQSIERLLAIKNNPIGFIELEADLDIESVTEIFIRINAQGVPLSQSDFAMSKIASYEGGDNFGVNLRKCIDYFCHVAREPQFYRHIVENDPEFASTIYLPKIAWLKDENDDLYDPEYADVLRVSFIKEFERGKMSELVSLLSGRNFETRKFEQNIVEESFQKLQKGVLDFVNETHFKRFLMIINSCGYISSNLIRSKNVLNFAYVLYLKLRDQGVDGALIETYVRRWFVMSQLTSRYSGSAETTFDADIKNIARRGIENYLKSIEEAGLSDAFWNVGLVESLDTASINSPFVNLFFAAQVRAGDKGFLSSDITVADMITHRGDIHHLFPKEYLKTKYRSRREYNQIANFVYAQTEVNIKIGKKAPKDYFQEILEQCRNSKPKYGGITNIEELKENMRQHCIPEGIENMTIDDYLQFLEERRKLMAKRIEQYYRGL